MNPSFLILNLPCNGFGDIIFAYKIYMFLSSWYKNSTIRIGTTDVAKFVSIGIDKSILYDLLKKTYKLKDCRTARKLKFHDVDGKAIRVPHFDYIIVAPLTYDSVAKISDIRLLIPYSTKDNTIFLTEYNSKESPSKNVYMTGLGFNKRGEPHLGLLLYKPYIIPPRLSTLEHPYTIAYIADADNAVKECFFSFIQYITHKYNNFDDLDIIVTQYISDKTQKSKTFVTNLLHYIDKRIYPNVQLHTKTNSYMIRESSNSNGPTLHLRGDILPQKYVDMFSIYKYSIEDLLVTGDQSITDVLMCGRDKNIWYQIMPWKKMFANRLAYYVGTDIYKTKRTACGHLRYLKWKGDYTAIIKNWNFSILGKHMIKNWVENTQ